MPENLPIVENIKNSKKRLKQIKEDKNLSENTEEES
jgi:hypothetical protein